MQRLRELAKLLIGRLPIDCHQMMIFKQQTALLPPRLLTETPKTVCLRLTSEVYSSQRSRHSTSGSGFYDPLRRGHKSQRNGETHSPERCPAAKPV